MARSSSDSFSYSVLWKNNTILGFVLGLITGLFIAVMIAMIITRSPTPFNSSTTKQEKQEKQAEASLPYTDPNKPLYGNREAPKEAYQKAQADKQEGADTSASAAKTEKEPDVSVMLQAGAYRDRKDAEQMRAKLALLGIEAAIREAKSNDNTVFRVQSGPYTPKKLEGVQKNLKENGVDFVIIRSH